MRAFILAAGLGTRLKPWTLTHPKALVPVNGVPMLERVILNLKNQGVNNIVINIHHFGQQIIDFVESKDFDIRIDISDERDCLLDTGGALLHAAPLLNHYKEPVLIHNVDILSNVDLCQLWKKHATTQPGATLLVSDRHSSRKLIFDNELNLKGWHNNATGQFRPSNYLSSPLDKEYAFSGIHIIGEKVYNEILCLGLKDSFPIMDYYLNSFRQTPISGCIQRHLELLDIGKPDTLARAGSMFL